MKFSILTFLFLATCCLAGDLRSAAERLWIYYAYLLNIEHAYSLPKDDPEYGKLTIAPTLAGHGPHSRANFKEFLRYIDVLPKEPDLDLTKIFNMDVIARAFVKKGLDYKLRPERIVPGSSLYNMLVKVAETAQKAKTFLQPPRVISADATKLLKLVDDALDAVAMKETAFGGYKWTIIDEEGTARLHPNDLTWVHDWKRARAADPNVDPNEKPEAGHQNLINHYIHQVRPRQRQC